MNRILLLLYTCFVLIFGQFICLSIPTNGINNDESTTKSIAIINIKINTTAIFNETDKISQNIYKVEQLCKTHNLTDECDHLSLLKNDMSKFTKKNKRLRQKRFLPLLITILFSKNYPKTGQIDQKIVDDLQSYDKLNKNLTEKHIQINKEWLGIQEQIFKQITKNIEKLEIEVKLNQLIQLLISILNKYNELLQKIMNILTETNINDIVDVIGQNEFISVIENINDTLGPDEQLISNDLHKIIDKSNISISYSDLTMYLKFEIPIVIIGGRNWCKDKKLLIGPGHNKRNISCHIKERITFVEIMINKYKIPEASKIKSIAENYKDNNVTFEIRKIDKKFQTLINESKPEIKKISISTNVSENQTVWLFVIAIFYVILFFVIIRCTCLRYLTS